MMRSADIPTPPGVEPHVNGGRPLRPPGYPSARNPKRGPLTAALSVGLAVAAVWGVLGACAAPTYRFVSNDQLGSYFRLPRTWQAQDVTDQRTEGRIAADPGAIVTLWDLRFLGPAGPPSTIVAGTGSSAALPSNVVGRVLIVDLGPTQTQKLALSDIRKSFSMLEHDPLFPPEDIDSDQIEVASYEQLAAGESLTGSRVVSNLDLDPDGDAGLWFTESQSMLFDNRSGLLYVLTMRCVADCYQRNQQQIDEIANSFTVRT
ncbi:MAG: hypothetical protein ACKV2O_11990 [Acidimicrobiales bacterium]